jgi:hypothetical protein
MILITQFQAKREGAKNRNRAEKRLDKLRFALYTLPQNEP